MKTPRMLLVAGCIVGLTTLPALGNDKSKDDRFRSMDTDGDGRISRSESEAHARQMFSQLDTNSDGRVTALEHGSSGAGSSRSDARGIGADASGQGDKAKEKIKMYDQNNDGRLTTSEWQRGSVEKFNKTDTNGDGFLSQEELAAGHKKHKDKRD